MTRSRLVAGLAAGAVALALTGATLAPTSAATPPSVVTVYKSPSCGCCSAWVEHMKEAGFQVAVKDLPDVSPIKAESGVPGKLQSCHTAIVDGYVLEGHVPADLVKKLLKERPKVAGLAVPGMPMGSPGMEGPRKDPYDVLTFTVAGQTTVYAKR